MRLDGQSVRQRKRFVLERGKREQRKPDVERADKLHRKAFRITGLRLRGLREDHPS